MLAEREGDCGGDALEGEAIWGAGLKAFVLEGSHEVLDLGWADGERLNDLSGTASVGGAHEMVEEIGIEREGDAFHLPGSFEADGMAAALRHDPKRAGANPLHAGEVRAFDLRADGGAGVEVEVMLLRLALGKLRRIICVVLDVESSCGQVRMPSYDMRDDGNDLRSLLH